MSVLRTCSEPGCGTRTLGLYCIAHEAGFARLEMCPPAYRLRLTQPRHVSAKRRVDVRAEESLTA
jgi:hypothetical protein